MTAELRINPLDASDTIVAQATAPARGALAIIRLAGPNAHGIGAAAIDPWPDAPRRATLAAVKDGDGTTLDEAIVIRYDAPRSFTGEDAVEIITHGGLVVPTTVMGALVGLGARVAKPGEFSRRAVLNGKLDILQSEATGDLIDASSRAAQRVALRQLDGGLSRRILALRDEIVGLEALIAYDIDFPEEDDGPIAPARIESATANLISSLEKLLSTSRVGTLVREGALVVLAGAPNVGKSSLFNAMLGENRAIVTEIPGTTRDAIEAVIDTPTIPLRLVDTAGMREASDVVERIGVEISASYVARASVVLACVDGFDSLTALQRALDGKTEAPIVVVWTKSDLKSPSASDLTRARTALHATESVAASAETGSGIDELLGAVTSLLVAHDGVLEPDAPMLVKERHCFAVDAALSEVRAFQDAWRSRALPAPVAAVHLRTAITALEDLIGAVDVEDVLDEVFRRFCVGK
jgi:tRNA modification GTPase